MNYKKIILLVSLCSFQHIAQTTTGWKNFASMNKITSAVVTQNGIWAGSDGGAFYFNFKDSTYQTFTKTEGMNGSPITAMAKDSSGNIWFGSQNGKIDVYSPTTKIFKNIFDVYNSERTEKRINSISIYGDTAFVSTSFGLSLLNTKTFSFYDTFFKLGNFASNIDVNYSYKKNNIIYAATSSGLAVQKPGTTNLVAPESWNTYTTSDGLSSNTIYKIETYHDTLFVSTPKGFSIYSGNSWQKIFPSFANNLIADFIVSNDSLFFLTEGYIFSYASGNVSLLVTEQHLNSVNIVGIQNSKIMLASNSGIILNFRNGTVKNIFPNGPTANNFFDMAVDKDDNLWVATGKDVGGLGFYRYNGLWNIYNMNTALLNSNAFHKVATGSDNAIYFANWGNGFLKIKNDTTFQFFSATNTPLVGIPKNLLFLVIADMQTDSKGNLWVLNYWPADKKVINVLTSDSTWYTYENLPDPNIIEYIRLTIDQYDTKWFVSQNPGKSGLYYFNENSSMANLSDDRSGYVPGLNSNSVSCLALDKRGELWVGTNSGVNVISNPNAILNSSSSALKITSVFSLRQQSINCLAVDAINRKWVGTNQGLILTSTDGTSIIETFDRKNSPLLSDQIKSLTIDEKNGIVYAAVDGGLTAFYTTALAPNSTFSTIETSPSPFLIGNNSTLLTIDGLIKDSEIKILSISGNLIREFSSPGGKIAFWDGKNDDGDFVNSGVYLIVAYDKEGNSVATGKVAIVRQ